MTPGVLTPGVLTPGVKTPGMMPDMIYTVTLNPALDLELTVAAIELDCVLRASTTQVDAGGKGFNVSRALAALGVPSIALGFVGGRTGEHLKARLEQLGISTDFVHVSGETRTNLSVVTEPASHYLKVNQAGPTIQPEEQDAMVGKVRQRARAGEAWIFSGNLPPGIPADIYAQLIALVRSSGGKAILDTSGHALHLGARAGPFLVKPNALEASQLTGHEVGNPSQARQAAAKMHAWGIALVLISLGSAGAVLSDGRQAWWGQPPRIAERNPIGAGDAALAGCVYALEQGAPAAEALRWSVACGAAAASLPGTAVGDRALVEALSAQVKIEHLG